jgi:hypothetical protein
LREPRRRHLRSRPKATAELQTKILSEDSMGNEADTTERTSAPRRNRQTAAEEPLNPPEAAKSLLRQLEERLALPLAQKAEISRQRTSISLAAHMGSPDDRARLDELNQEGAILAGQIEGLEAAISQAKALIAEAETNAAAEVDRRKRREVLQLADEIRGHAERIDALWRQSIDEYGDLQTKLTAIVQLGVGRPTQQQVRVACQRALVAAFIGTPLQSQLLAPNQRHSVSDLVNSWANAAEAWAGRNAE